MALPRGANRCPANLLNIEYSASGNIANKIKQSPSELPLVPLGSELSIEMTKIPNVARKIAIHIRGLIFSPKYKGTEAKEAERKSAAVYGGGQKE